MSQSPDDQEAEARISALENGPWMKKAEPAWREIALHDARPPLVINSAGLVDFEKTFKGVAPKRQERLADLLVLHWKKDITTKKVRLRLAFDEALELFKLYELGIATGYLTIDAVSERLRNKMLDLLWSKASRDYVQAYDYVGVSFLASRLGLDIGYGQYSAPECHEGSEARFASFLSQHQLWYGNELSLWLGLMDDFQILDSEEYDQQVVADFLASTKRFDDEETIWCIIAGMNQFVLVLSDLYRSLGEEERPRYGLFYLYYMALFFGCDSGHEGYTQSEEFYDWSRLLLDSVRCREYFKELESRAKRLDETRTGNLWEHYHSTLRGRIRDVRQFFDVTTTFLKVHSSR